MQRDVQNLLRLLFLVIAILIMKTVGSVHHATQEPTYPNTEGGAVVVTATDASFARKTVY